MSRLYNFQISKVNKYRAKLELGESVILGADFNRYLAYIISPAYM